jgi:hypothetical protein
MPRGLNKLTTISVRTAAPGKYSNGGRLWLYKGPDWGGQWFLRFTIHGRRREMGLMIGTTRRTGPHTFVARARDGKRPGTFADTLRRLLGGLTEQCK